MPTQGTQQANGNLAKEVGSFGLPVLANSMRIILVDGQLGGSIGPDLGVLGFLAPVLAEKLGAAGHSCQCLSPATHLHERWQEWEKPSLHDGARIVVVVLHRRTLPINLIKGQEALIHQLCPQDGAGLLEPAIAGPILA